MADKKIESVVHATLQSCIDNGLTYHEVGEVIRLLRDKLVDQRTALFRDETFRMSEN